MVDVTQADREAAAGSINEQKGGTTREEDMIRSGDWDDHPRVIEFARHRTNSEPRPAGDLREAIRKAKLAADEVYGVDWHRLEEISRFELVQYRRDLAWKAGQKARRANKTLKSNNRQQGTIFYDDWCDGWQREDREMHMEAARG